MKNNPPPLDWDYPPRAAYQGSNFTTAICYALALLLVGGAVTLLVLV